MDPCPKKHYVWDLFTFCTSAPSQLLPQIFEDLRDLNRQLSGLSSPTITIKDHCRGGLREVDTRTIPRMPRDVEGHLYPKHATQGYWLFDFDPKNGWSILSWALDRLAEYFWHHAAPHPCATFAKVNSESLRRTVKTSLSHTWANLKFWRRLQSNNLFGAAVGIPYASQPVSFHKGPVIKRLRYTQPAHIEVTETRTRWLQYLYRGPVPDGRANNFPLFTCSFETLFNEVDLDEKVASALWGPY